MVLLALILGAVIGSIIFFSILKKSFIINPSICGLVGSWFSCVGITAIILYYVFVIAEGVLTNIVSFLMEYWKFGLLVIGIIAFFGNRFK